MVCVLFAALWKRILLNFEKSLKIGQFVDVKLIVPKSSSTEFNLILFFLRLKPQKNQLFLHFFANSLISMENNGSIDCGALFFPV